MPLAWPAVVQLVVFFNSDSDRLLVLHVLVFVLFSLRFCVGGWLRFVTDSLDFYINVLKKRHHAKCMYFTKLQLVSKCYTVD